MIHVIEQNPLALIVLLIAFVAVMLVRGLFLGYPPPMLAGALLTAKEQAIVSAFADALFPAGGPIPLSGTEAGLVRYLDTYVRRSPPSMRLLIRLLLVFVEHNTWLFGPQPVRFTRMRPAERVAALEHMSKSSIYFRRVAFLSLRTMLSMGYLANAAVAQRIGCVERIAPFEPRMTAPRRLPTTPPEVRV